MSRENQSYCLQLGFAAEQKVPDDLADAVRAGGP